MSTVHSRRSFARLAGQVSVIAALSVGAWGCGPETFTYAKDAAEQGMSLYQQADYVDASAAFANATRQNPRDYKSFYYLGACYQAMKQYQQAIAAYRSCLAVAPLTRDGKYDVATHYQATDALAHSIANSGDSASEITAMEKRAGATPSVDDQWLLAKIYRYTGDADAAIEAYTKAVLIDSTRFDVAKEAGLYEEGLGQSERAATTLKKAYADNPDDEEVNAALRKLGVVVGPSLRDPHLLSHF